SASRLSFLIRRDGFHQGHHQPSAPRMSSQSSTIVQRMLLGRPTNRTAQQLRFAYWLPVNANVKVDVRFWKVLSAELGKLIVNNKWSVLPCVSVVRLLSAKLVPIIARFASTALVEPPQV